ncbi:MAG: stage II sporulation protein D [Oscillospiraceae bacterium]|nr:stage II sporulation protein D [Oscillospiraceae bacterium]
MRFRSLFILLLLISFVLAPAAALDFAHADAANEHSVPESTGQAETAPTTNAALKITEAPSVTTAAQNTADYKVKLLRKESGKLEQIALEDYAAGAIAAEMPLSYEPEALKAQAVACRSNAIYAREHLDASLNGADLSDYSGAHQGYLDEAQRKAKWGGSFAANEEKCRAAVRDTAGKILQYKGKTAFAAFHAISCGITESAKNVWGNDLAYLRPVNSAGDVLSPSYAQSIAVPVAEFNEKLVALGCEIKDGKITVGKTSLTDSGTVASLELGGKAVKGTKVREIFNLPSAAFTLTLTDVGAVFDCKGRGHGVGMSQFGAQTMAQQGTAWAEILGHYYAGTELYSAPE